MNIKRIKHPVYDVVADGAIASTEIGEGRLIPGVVIFTNGDSTLADLIQFHQSTPPGDVQLQWARKPFKKNALILNMEFKKPMEFNFGILFHLSEHYSIVDGIIQSRGLYIQNGKMGDKFSNMEAPKILIEVPDLGFGKKWNSRIVDILYGKYRKKGLSKKDARVATQSHLKSMRETWHIRANGK